MYRQGQRLLLALAASPADGGGEEDSGQLSVGGGILAAVGSVVCVILILLLCACRKSDRKDEIEDVELQQNTKKGNRKSQVHTPQESGDAKSKVDIEAVGVNGGAGQTSKTFPGHSRQASSGSAHMRPTSLRELPEPPVSSNHHSRNKSLSGIDLPSTSTKSGAGSGGGATAEGSGEYPYPQLGHHPRNSKNNAAAGANGKEKVKSHSDGYDHLGPKQTMKPTDYDQLGEPENADAETPLSEISGGLDGHYSMLRERTYAVVVDVKAKAKGLFDPYSKVKDKDDSGSDYYSQVKEEDPYNHISDGNVSTSFIRRLRQSHDFDDTYSTVQDGSGGDLKSVLESIGTARATSSHISPSTSSHISNSPSNQQDDDEDVEDEYAVVQKAKGLPEHPAEKDGRSHSDHDISPYNVGPPPEPPRLYKDYDNVETSAAKHKREHKYSKVTARESLASMSARNALNPYEIVADLPENTYATVEGGSGDGVVIRGGAAAGGDMEKRLSQTSDTYAEIGISGEGLSSSIISTNSSSVGGNNSSSISNIAPVPPSLDSLHLMTKSQTSSEGDRLSDRHLASPEDSGMSLNIWGDIQDGEDSEGGYSTLKKPDPGLQGLSLPAIPASAFVTDEDSGEVTLVPNYQTVKDCISDNEGMEEAESDPNYESVDEARAKVALLKARNSSSLDSRMSPFNSKSGASNNVTVVKVLNMNSAMGGVDLAESKEELQKSRPRRRRLDHDYEEVDLSPPPSPITPLSSNHNTSSYHTTSVSTNNASLSSQAGSGSDLFDARERAIQSHMYEELTVVRAKTSEMSKAKKANSLAKGGSEDKKTSSNDKKKAEEKHKSSSEDKRKHESEDKRKNVSDDRKKNVNDEKKKTDDKKKSGSAVHNGTRI